LNICLVLLALQGCVNKGSEKVIILHEGSYIVKARYVNGVRNGKSEIYDSVGALTGTLTYRNSILSGPCVHYFRNGVVSDSVNYECDKEQGYWRHFFPNGDPRHINYYYYGLEFGPNLWYDKDTILRTYQFLDFERDPIVICSYDNHGNFDSVKKFDLRVMLEDREKNGISLVKFFAYLPQIPLTKESYTIGIADKNHMKQKLCDIEGSNFMIDTLLSMPQPGYHFYLRCDLKANEGGYSETHVVEMIKTEGEKSE